MNLIDTLIGKCREIRVFDPEALENVAKKYGDNLYYANNQYDAIYGAHCLVVLTEWTAFRNPDLNFVLDSLIDKVVYDGRNIFDPQEMLSLGFRYFSIGRPTHFNSKLIEETIS